MYTVGDKVVHPMHGAGVIAEITEERMRGVTRRYYVFVASLNRLTLKIPVESDSTVGLRHPLTHSQLSKLLSSLSRVEEKLNGNWNQRYREYMERVKSGDPHEVGCVIKSLMHREARRGLSTVEHKLLGNAKQILLSEVMLVEGVAYEEAERLLNRSMLAE